MSDNDNKNAFDKLVAGLSSADRNAMLRRIHESTMQTVQIVTPDPDSNDQYQTLKVKLQNESFIYRFFLWIRALFQGNASKEQIYNDDQIANLAKKINHNHPGIINHKTKSLDYLFYERLQVLKEAADFFKPYCSFINENPGDFYVFMSSFVAPDLAEQINQRADPFALPFGKEPSPDVRSDLAKKLDEILKNMDSGMKSTLYAAVVASNWLIHFVSLPYLHITAQFTNVAGDVYTAPYSSVITDFNEFAAVFTKIQPIDNEVLEALFLFSQRKNLSQNLQEQDVEKSTKEYLSRANTYLVTIQEYIAELSIFKLGRVISNNYDWEPKNMEGAEGWFPLFRAQWRKIQDIRWNDWLREQKKMTLSESLKMDFGLDEFPTFKYRPWERLWSPVTFGCELTGGFLSWFATEKYDEIIFNLNLVIMEGIFLKSENRTEYSEGVNNFVNANTNMKSLVEKLSPKGDYGRMFQDFAENKVHTLQVQNQISSMMRDTEAVIKDCIKLFGKGARAIERTFHGFFDEDKDGIHEGLQNMNTIRGRENSNFRHTLQEIRNIIKQSLYYISELEPIDAVSEK